MVTSILAWWLDSRDQRERDWETKIVHIYREANHLADCLAARGHDIDRGSTLRLEDDQRSVDGRIMMSEV
ncbi:hypothetical protein LINPERPRIM_LOCUS7760 [Linum perenne]